MTEADVVAGVLLFGDHRLRPVRRRRLRRGVLGPDRRRRGARRRGRARSIDHSIGPVWEANHVWLIFCLVVAVDRVLAGVRVDHAHAVRPADARRARHRAARLELRVPQSRSCARSEQRVFGAHLRHLVGDRAVLHGRGRGRDRVGPRPGGRQGRRSVVELDQPDVDPRRRARGHRVRVPRGRVPRVGRPPPRPTTRPGRVLPPARGDRRGRRGRRSRSSGIFVLARRRDVRVPRADVARVAARHRVGAVRHRRRCVLLVRGAHRGRARAVRRRGRDASSGRGASRSGRTCSRRR